MSDERVRQNKNSDPVHVTYSLTSQNYISARLPQDIIFLHELTTLHSEGMLRIALSQFYASFMYSVLMKANLTSVADQRYILL